MSASAWEPRWEPRWEHGSEFHWEGSEPAGDDPDRQWLASLASAGFASGRGALAALLSVRGWDRVWLPSYVCAELVEAVGAVGDRVHFYADHPGRAQAEPPAGLEAGDAVVRINYFGLREPESAAAWRERGVEVIDDHTHDPCSLWARDSDADYCLASLRKSLPVPDGALLWSPVAKPLPTPGPASEASADKLAAMVLKGLYLRGHAVDKAAFRTLALAGEARLGACGSAGMSVAAQAMVASTAISNWRARRRQNYADFSDALRDARLCGLGPISTGPIPTGGSPFACVLRCADRRARDQLRAGLIAAQVYPALLWSLDEFTGHGERFAESCALSERLLMLHCDARYTGQDMRRVAAAVVELSETAAPTQ